VIASVPSVLAKLDADQLWQALFSGFAVGAKYALVALGFVVIFKATGVINFAQASFVLAGGYLTYNAITTWGWSFWPAVVAAMVGGALIGVALEGLVLRRMVGEQPFTLIMVTIGVLYVIDNLVTAIWGPDTQNLGDPWGTQTVEVGGVILAHRELWSIGITAVVLIAFFAFFRFSPLGLAMRATALDQEAALAQGISARRVYRASWAIAGMVAALSGVMLSAGGSQLNPTVGLVALAAFPAMILGGLESPLGAVVGGLIIGLVQQLTAVLQPEYAEWLGNSFERVSPYLVMILILLVRPYGLFGTREVRRV
jgi:branched-chain amino acid transport system permease protein